MFGVIYTGTYAIDGVAYVDATVASSLWYWQIQPTPVAKLKKKMGHPASVVREMSV